MGRIFVIGEDALCCALGIRLVTDVKGWELAHQAINTRGVTRLQKAMRRYANLAKRFPVLCLADTDRKCAALLRKAWLPAKAPNALLLRFAVTESESWVLADHTRFAEFFGVAAANVPRQPDDVDDAKRLVLTLAGQSRTRLIRQEVVSRHDPTKPGSGYNVHLSGFVMDRWRPFEAAKSSPSLERAIRRLEQLKEVER